MNSSIQPNSDRPVSMLVADDDPDFQILVKSALSKAGFKSKAHFLNDGEQVMSYLRGEGQCDDREIRRIPSLILLDLNMPRKDGAETLDEIRSHPDFKSIPVVVVTTSQTKEEISRMYELGANSFITKPATFEGLTDLMQSIVNYWFEKVSLPSH